MPPRAAMEAAPLLEVAEEVQVRGGAAERPRRVPGRTTGAGADSYDPGDEAHMAAAATQELRRRTFLPARAATLARAPHTSGDQRTEPAHSVPAHSDPEQPDPAQPKPVGRP